MRRSIINSLIQQNNSYIIVDELTGENIKTAQDLAKAQNLRLVTKRVSSFGSFDEFEQGFMVLKEARAALIKEIPKYDQILPVAFPISPMPDDFFQPSKFPCPSPLVRVPRTNESKSASVHAHTACNMVVQTGNLLHRTSSINADLLMMGMEGGNLSLFALPGAMDQPKISWG